MENAELIGLTRQTALKRQLAVIANNLANLNTSGFKNEKLLYEEYKMPVAKMSEFPRRMDRPLSYVQDFSSFRDMRGGEIRMTGNPLDVAINGDGFFVVDTPEGERFTRAGNFQINGNGELVTMDGNTVQGDGGPITFAPDETDISIARDGSISTNQGQRGRLRIVGFENESALNPVGSNLFATNDALPPVDVVSPRVQQGALEGSNVEGVTEMTRMIEVTRAYRTVAQLMKDQNDLMTNAIQKLGTTDS
ncbi:flagellar basal-body rod protein FlgF [Breoghania corrubedonensis]|uniref:Flagellar basal-body rod protein FlgF n=1 Tax=Breoghania corrubedonensis TaxID=665038 RepID=A0A2T5VDG2_9HYPH|nr:flagellar basal-body rod protein FlgF [Breoghania corrubedonensis]PTW61775.1 flagellar basal-body rod protein FlgF [Breoghania corrubedonensis]